MIPDYHRKKRAMVAPFLVLALACCVAGFGASWNRTNASAVTAQDAIRVLQTARDETEREQAMGRLNRMARDAITALVQQEKSGDRKAMIYLDSIARAIEQERK